MNQFIINIYNYCLTNEICLICNEPLIRSAYSNNCPNKHSALYKAEHSIEIYTPLNFYINLLSPNLINIYQSHLFRRLDISDMKLSSLDDLFNAINKFLTFQ